MKNLLMIFAFAFAFSVGSNALACGPVEGVWHLSYAIYKNKNGKVVSEIKSGSAHAIKILANGDFTYIMVDKVGKFLGAHYGGFYLKDDGKYVEVIRFSSVDRASGMVHTYACSMNDETWIIKSIGDEITKETHWRRPKT